MSVREVYPDRHLRLPSRREGPAEALVILLHGVGSSAHAMAPAAQAISLGLGHAAVVALNAVEPFDLGQSGFQWFSVAGVTEANRAQRVAEALQHVEAMIESECARANVSHERTAVVGFSQGAVMALHLLVASQRPPKAIVSWAGRLALPLQCTRNILASILLSHGNSDPVIPVSELEFAATKLRAIGCSVQTELVAAHGHSIHRNQLESSIRFLSSHLQAYDSYPGPKPRGHSSHGTV